MMQRFGPATRPPSPRLFSPSASRPGRARGFMHGLWVALGVGVLAIGGCDKAGAYGEVNSIIVGASMALWDEVGEAVATGLEPTIFTVRDERTFKITHQDPLAPDWEILREFKQVLLIGTPEDPWIAEALEESDTNPEPVGGASIFQLVDIWARGQLVTVLLLSAGGGADEVEAHVDELLELFDEQYRTYAQARMFVSGHDSLLADTLRALGGFALDLPRVYLWDHQDSVFIFRNDNPDPAELIREIAVTWRSPIDEPLADSAILDWRLSLTREYYTDEQVVSGQIAPDRGPSDEIREIRGIWESPPEAWPAAGPFLTRTRACPAQDRLYLLDSWLYAPGKDKYEYMLQLEYILDSFDCESGLPAAAM